MNWCANCGKTWTGGLREHAGICPACGHDSLTGYTPRTRPDGTPNYTQGEER